MRVQYLKVEKRKGLGERDETRTVENLNTVVFCLILKSRSCPEVYTQFSKNFVNTLNKEFLGIDVFLVADIFLLFPEPQE